MEISVCSVILDGMEDYIKVFLHSLLKYSKYVKEIIFVKVDGKDEGLIYHQEVSNIKINTFGFPIAKSVVHPARKGWILANCGHALGMHYAIDQANHPYTWLSDPDIFLLGNVDETFLDLMQKYELGIVGVSHFNIQEQCYLDFPCITNCLIKRDTLPSADWLKGFLYFQSGMKGQTLKLSQLDGKYLSPGPIQEFISEFPNPYGTFDVGCNLYLWYKKQRWLSFQLPIEQIYSNNLGFQNLIYPLNYSTSRHRSNFLLEDDLGDHPLLYHRTRGTRESGKDFLQLYEQLLGEHLTNDLVCL